MDRHSLIEGLRSLEGEIVAQLDNLDSTRARLFQVIEAELQDKEHVKALAQTLSENLMQLRELYQRVIYKTTLLAKTEVSD